MNATNSYKSIPLKGETDGSKFFRKGENISVEKQNDFLFARIQNHVGVVQITIINEMGERVFDEIIDASVQPLFIISLLGLPDGNYEITFSNERINLKGEFEM